VVPEDTSHGYNFFSKIKIPVICCFTDIQPGNWNHYFMEHYDSPGFAEASACAFEIPVKLSQADASN
jgi:hypothetical protein